VAGLNIAWQTAWIAAATAAAVTLLVEYAAKPWLEVRKARILDETRAFREVQAAFRRIDGLLQSSQNAKLVQWAPGPVAEDLSQAHDAIRQLRVDLAHTRPGRIPVPAMDLLTFVTSAFDACCGYGVAAIQQGLPVEAQLERMHIEPELWDAFYAVGSYLHTPRYRLVSSTRRFQKVMRLLETLVTQAAAESTPPADV
jgi:hypothetical protein